MNFDRAIGRNCAPSKGQEPRRGDRERPDSAPETERWPDEGLRHPPLKNVRKVRVRLNHIGPLPPRIVYDPECD